MKFEQIFERTEGLSSGMTKEKNRKKCFLNDDAETQAKKVQAMEKFYKDAKKVRETEEKLGGIFRELFASIDIDEQPEDEMQNIAEQLLTKKSWDIEKHPDYEKQLWYVIRYNLIPNMLSKYFGRKKTNLSDDELQMRNFEGTGIREKPCRRAGADRERINEFEVNEEYGNLISGMKEMEKYDRMDRGAYETENESAEREKKLESDRAKVSAADKAVGKCDDYEVQVLWETIKNADDYGKINKLAEMKMGRTPMEMKVIRRRLRKVLDKQKSGKSN